MRYRVGDFVDLIQGITSKDSTPQEVIQKTLLELLPTPLSLGPLLPLFLGVEWPEPVKRGMPGFVKKASGWYEDFIDLKYQTLY